MLLCLYVRFDREDRSLKKIVSLFGNILCFPPYNSSGVSFMKDDFLWKIILPIVILKCNLL